jgi:predicted RNA-binding Zn-ribbon protein involved in translation (DUF1610 family)
MRVVTPALAKCPLCGRELVVRDGRIREHLPRESWADRKCPGSGGKVGA